MTKRFRKILLSKGSEVDKTAKSLSCLRLYKSSGNVCLFVVLEVESIFTYAANSNPRYHEVISFSIQVGVNILLATTEFYHEQVYRLDLFHMFLLVLFGSFTAFPFSWGGGGSDVFGKGGTLKELFLTTRWFFLKRKKLVTQNIKEFFFIKC